MFLLLKGKHRLFEISSQSFSSTAYIMQSIVSDLIQSYFHNEQIIWHHVSAKYNQENTMGLFTNMWPAYFNGQVWTGLAPVIHSTTICRILEIPKCDEIYKMLVTYLHEHYKEFPFIKKCQYGILLTRFNRHVHLTT